MARMAGPLLVTFAAGQLGPWRIERIDAPRGDTLAAAERLEMLEGVRRSPSAAWVLCGTTSNDRYVTRAESAQLAARQPPLGRPEATRAALISIRKSEAWWQLAQDERRAIFEERSRHVSIGLEYLPAIARRLHHGRDLGEPFDFLTWFEFAPEEAGRFDELIARLRSSEEWRFVEREVDIRLARP